MADAPQGLLRGACGECCHEWIIAYLPMEFTRVSLLMKRAACPKCGCVRVRVASPETIRIVTPAESTRTE